MNQQVWIDSFTRQAAKRGCGMCGNRVPSVYAVQFYLLPTRLLQKSHRDRKQTVLYCRDCYETDTNLTILIDGHPCGLPKKGLDIENRRPLCCIGCGTSVLQILANKELHGLITASLWMSGSCIESHPLALFCSVCAVKKLVTLLAEM